MGKSKIVYLVVPPNEKSYGLGMLLVDLFLGFLTCGIWWIIRLLWWGGRR